jgi:hypothetical protein
MPCSEGRGASEYQTSKRARCRGSRRGKGAADCCLPWKGRGLSGGMKREGREGGEERGRGGSLRGGGPGERLGERGVDHDSQWEETFGREARGGSLKEGVESERRGEEKDWASDSEGSRHCCGC